MADINEMDYIDVETIDIPLEDGTFLECAVLEQFEIDDQGYIFLSPIEDDVISDDYFIYRYHEDDEDIILDYIDDENELAEVNAIYLKLLEEDEETEEE